MRGDNWLQKILYLLMAVLGTYILYKGSGLLLGSGTVQKVMDSGRLQRGLEDSAMRTYAPGYTASVEDREGGSPVSGWMRQVVPVYSYLAEQSQDTERESGMTEEQETAQDASRSAAQDTDGQAGEQSRSLSGEEGQAESRSVSAAGETAGEQSVEDGEKIVENLPGGEGAADYLPEETAPREIPTEAQSDPLREAMGRDVSGALLEQIADYNYLLSNYFTVDGGTAADEELLDGVSLLEEDLSIRKNPGVPQILIYHTHSQEEFIDSIPGDRDTTIVGMGEVLAELLRDRYGYQVIHDEGVYDLVDGVLDRSAAYDYARASIQEILEEHPTIEVVIDLHRDGVEGQKFVTDINGQPTSMIMFFNGISRNSQDEPISYLPNPYTTQNLAFSLQLQLKAREQYPGYTRNIYLKAERFNLHLRPRSLLIEAGTQLNTVEEEQNAMAPLADLLDQVLSGR